MLNIYQEIYQNVEWWQRMNTLLSSFFLDSKRKKCCSFQCLLAQERALFWLVFQRKGECPCVFNCSISLKLFSTISFYQSCQCLCMQENFPVIKFERTVLALAFPDSSHIFSMKLLLLPLSYLDFFFQYIKKTFYSERSTWCFILKHQRRYTDKHLFSSRKLAFMLDLATGHQINCFP